MSTKYLGKAAVWGINATATASSLGTILIQSYKFKPSADTADLMDKAGTVGRVVANRHETLSMEGVFTGTTQADALTQAVKTPDIGDVVTVTDTTVDTEIAGTWVITDAEKSAEVKGLITVSLTMDRFPDASGFSTVIS